MKTVTRVILCVLGIALCYGCAAPLTINQMTINQIQFVGSHNSYKMAMSAADMAALRIRNPAAAQSLDYAHISLPAQLDLGLRKLELDVFYDPQQQRFPVGHVQRIDMNSQCASLRICLQQVRNWSEQHPQHIPIWISFNAKDQKVTGLPDPAPFTADALLQMDEIIEQMLAGRLIRPSDIQDLQWPTVHASRGKFLLILDEGGDKRELYWQNWQARPMFTNAPVGHQAAAVMIVNDPIAQGDEIRALVRAGYLVRTRADADTVEARSGSTRRRDAAFASGAQAISTDYYLPAQDTGYQVKITNGVRCNPVSAPAGCRSPEQ